MTETGFKIPLLVNKVILMSIRISIAANNITIAIPASITNLISYHRTIGIRLNKRILEVNAK